MFKKVGAGVLDITQLLKTAHSEKKDHSLEQISEAYTQADITIEEETELRRRYNYIQEFEAYAKIETDSERLKNMRNELQRDIAAKKYPAQDKQNLEKIIACIAAEKHRPELLSDFSPAMPVLLPNPLYDPEVEDFLDSSYSGYVTIDSPASELKEDVRRLSR